MRVIITVCCLIMCMGVLVGCGSLDDYTTTGSSEQISDTENYIVGETEGDPESPSGYTVTRINVDRDVIDSLEVNLVEHYENEYKKVESLFCDSSKWQNLVTNNNQVEMGNVNITYKIDQHFSYAQSAQILYFFEVDDKAYCYEEPVLEENEIGTLYYCDYEEFLAVKNLFLE